MQQQNIGIKAKKIIQTTGYSFNRTLIHFI